MLHTVQLVNVSVSTLPADVLAGTSSELAWFSLSWSRALTSIPPTLLGDRVSVDTLMLAHAPNLRAIPPDLLVGVRSLRVLQIESCGVRSLPFGLLRNTSLVEYGATLVLRRLQLTWLPADLVDMPFESYASQRSFRASVFCWPHTGCTSLLVAGRT